METLNKSRIVLTALAVLAAAVLFVTYGTVLPSAPFASIPLNGPTAVDSDGRITGVVDTESRRALILNADGDLTGVVSCATTDSPFDAITDVCVKDGLVYLSGARFAPDSDAIEQERVAVYDKGGNFQGVVFEKDGDGSAIPSIKSLNDAATGVVISYEKRADWDSAQEAYHEEVKDRTGTDAIDEPGNEVAFLLLGSAEPHTVDTGDVPIHDAAFSDGDGARYAVLSVRGVLNDEASDLGSQQFTGRVFAAIDLGDGVLYACDDETGGLVAISRDSPEARVLVDGDGYDSVHENNGVISLCDGKTDKVVLADAAGVVTSEFTEAKPSIGFSARMMLVWASGLYLAVLALVLAIRKVRRLVKEGRTEGIGPMFMAVAVVAAIAVAVGSLSFASYQKMLELRANEINMCADYLEACAGDLSGAMEAANDRDAIRGSGEELTEAAGNIIEAASPALAMVGAADNNGIGLYCTIYGKDAKGIFYLYGSSAEYVMGSSAHGLQDNGLADAFEGEYSPGGELLRGRTLRDASQYRLVRIPSTDGKGVAGVIEIGSKMRSFESSIVGDLAQRILTLLVLVLVVYLAYSELRACGRCLFSYRQRQQVDGARAVAVLTRPFTLAITMLTGIDSVMTVLIARDLLAKAGMGDSSPLLAVPAVMLGIGLVIGQSLYGIAGSRVGLRKLMAVGASVMLACTCLTGAAVFSGAFWLYCAAKLAMAVPFGMLYTLGYSLPRLAGDGETRACAASDVKRTDTSAAALGTVLGGYAAQALGDVWVYALVAVACLPVILMALNLLPRGMSPLEELAQPDYVHGSMRDLARTPAFAIALFIVLPATIAAGYASFLFPLFSADLGLSKADINNIVVLGQLVVYVLIGSVERAEARHGKWGVSTLAVLLLGAVFLLFAVNTTLAWSVAVIAIVAVLCKSSDGWKAMWLKVANEADIPAGKATGAMLATRSLALVAQPFILGALLGATSSFAVIVIGLLCLACAGLFFLTTRRSSLAKR